MVLQKAQNAVNSLKEKPQEDRKAVAGGIAITVVALLLVGWTFLFFKKVRSGAELDFSSAIPEEFQFSSVEDAQKSLLEGYTGFDELRTVRDQLLEQYTPAPVQADYQQSETDQFGRPTTSD